MKGLKDTLADLAGFRKRFEKLFSSAATKGTASSPDRASRLVHTTGFGSNPGNLRMLTHVPANLPKTPALVVALHGCTQTASVYDHGSGWSALADANGFVALFPEQQAANNPNACFNWFLASDTQRGRGEAHSIHEMIEHMVARHAVDRSRIFIVGLSAGGAMSAAMLASYPDVFAAGAVVAGLPHGAASNVQTAFEAMGGARHRTAREWGDLVRSASAHAGPWPKISLWHGSADRIVNPANMEHLVQQWSSVHGLDAKPDLEHELDGHSRRVWEQNGIAIMEAVSIAGMGHGVPLASTGAGERWGNPGPFHFDVGISSSRRILEFWGLADGELAFAREAHERPPLTVPLNGPRELEPVAEVALHAQGAPRAHDPSSVIAQALRTAGILKAGSKPGAGDPHGIIAATLRSVGLLKD